METTEQPQKLPCPQCHKTDSVGFAGRVGIKQNFHCKACKIKFSSSHGKFIRWTPKIRVKKPKIARMSEPHICKGCGKPYYKKFWGQLYHKECRPIKITKTKIQCEICGRYIWSNIPINSTERALCSFCQKRISDEKRAMKENQKNRVLGRCRNCRDTAYLYYGSGLCHCCYIKSKNPHVLDCQEVKEIC